MALCMTFLGTPCPSLWGYISDTIADICNELIHNPHWDHSRTFDDLSTTLDEALSLPDENPFHSAKSLAVQIPSNDIGKVDYYNDDSIGVALDVNDNPTRVSAVVPLATHAFSHPLNNEDPIPRNKIIFLKKFRAEGRMEESKKVLGWIINTRS